MDKLPSGIKAYNATGQKIKFDTSKGDIFVLKPRKEITTTISHANLYARDNIIFVKENISINNEVHEILSEAWKLGADIVIGSNEVALAYPGEIVTVTKLKNGLCNPYVFKTY